MVKESFLIVTGPFLQGQPSLGTTEIETPEGAGGDPEEHHLHLPLQPDCTLYKSKSDGKQVQANSYFVIILTMLLQRFKLTV